MGAEPIRLRAFTVLALAAQGVEGTVIELDAGPHARRDALVELALPGAAADPAVDGERGPLVLRELDREAPRTLPAQVLGGDPPALVWVVPGALARGERRRFLLERSFDPPADPAYFAGPGGQAVSLRRGTRELARYRAAPVAPPDGVDPIYARGGYLHPVFTPAGRAVTGDFPPAHLHHHGLWTAWTRTVFEGRAVDFWNSAAGEGRVEPVEVLDEEAGAHLVRLRAALRHVDLTAPGGPRAALDETWDVRASAAADATVVDLALEQRCATDSPLELSEYHYGGLGWRGPVGWEGEGARFLTSEGLDRLDGHASRPRWCAATGLVDGAEVTVALLDHPENPRAPQPVRLHPEEPFWCAAPVQLGPLTIAPDAPYRARYRVLAMDGPPDPERIDRHWRDWAEPPTARVVAD